MWTFFLFYSFFSPLLCADSDSPCTEAFTRAVRRATKAALRERKAKRRAKKQQKRPLEAAAAPPPSAKRARGSSSPASSGASCYICTEDGGGLLVSVCASCVNMSICWGCLQQHHKLYADGVSGLLSPHECPTCRRESASLSMLGLYVRAGRLACPQWGREILQLVWQQHQPRTFQCYCCPRAFSQASAMLQHLLDEPCSGWATYCTRCATHCADSYDAHARTHCPFGRSQCAHCHAEFTGPECGWQASMCYWHDQMAEDPNTVAWFLANQADNIGKFQALVCEQPTDPRRAPR